MNPGATDLFHPGQLFIENTAPSFLGITRGLQFVQFKILIIGFAFGYWKTPTTVYSGFLDTPLPSIWL